MLDVGTPMRAGGVGNLAHDLVDRVAARVDQNPEPALAAAVAEVRRRIEAGRTPVGLQRLAEALSAAPTAPAQRRPADDPAAGVELVRRYPFVTLQAPDPAAVAATLAAVLADGKRAIVTGADPDELAAVRAALPPPARALCLDGEPPLSDVELRELRALLVTATPARRARPSQVLPEPEQVPDPELVAELCKAAGRPGLPARDGAELIPELLGELTPERLAAIRETARRCDVEVSALGREGDAEWSWELLEGVLFAQLRRAFDRLLCGTAEAQDAADALRDVGDQMAVVGEVTPDGVEQLRRYADYLDAGGKTRAYFRSPEQRAVEPVLRHLRLDGAPLKDSKLLRQALGFVELIRSVEEIGAQCRQLGLPAPTDIPAVGRLNRQLRMVGAAAHAVEELRHEVLFIHPSSPVSMPDMATTEAVARAIISASGEAELAAARRRLAELAETFAASLPSVPMFTATVPAADDEAADDEGDDAERGVPAPEYLDAVHALRDNDVVAYLEAMLAMAGARREQADQQRLHELLTRLRTAAPGLADAWDGSARRTFAPGIARFQPVAELLAELPGADAADVVLLLGAATLDTGYLLVAAAAPRLLAAVDADTVPELTPSGLADRLGADRETVGTVLRRAAVPVVGSVTPDPSPCAAQPPAAPQPVVPAQRGAEPTPADPTRATKEPAV